MTLAEFKAWFEGYTEDLDGPPNAKQWKRIKAQVGKIDGTAIPRITWVDRYYDHVRSYWQDRGVGVGQNAAFLSATDAWSPQSAMYALGRADAAGES